MVAVNGGNAAAGFGVCAQDNVEVVTAACGTQLMPIPAGFVPTVAGALMVRFAFAVIAKLAVPAGKVQANATLALGTPAVAMVIAEVPLPPVSVTADTELSVGATGAAVAAGQVKPQTRGVAAPAVSVQVNVAVPAVAARVQPRSIEPAVVMYMPFGGVVVTALKVPPPAAPEIAHAVTEVEPPPVEPLGDTEMVDVVAPAKPAGKVTVVSAALGAGA